LDISQKKEAFSRAYVCAVAAVAGLVHSKPEPDIVKVDMELTRKGGAPPWRNPKVALQLRDCA